MPSEFDLIALLRERLEAAGVPVADRVAVGPGDDAAVTVPMGATATSVDAIVEGVHFRRSTHPPEAIGHKALAAALSDLAAMGAEQGEAYVQLGLPGDLSEPEAIGIADGLGALAGECGVAIAGGDVVASPVLFLAMTVVGHAQDPASLVTRAGASPGEALVLTGRIGGAAAGLRLLEQDDLKAALEPATAGALIERQLRPRALLEAGSALRASGATAMIDVSDGLGADASHLARASGVRLEIELGAGLIDAGVEAVANADGEDPFEFAASGGEDYELLATVPQERVSEALEALRRTASDPAEIGRVEVGEGVVLRGPRGREVSAGGFDQIRSRVPGEPT